jgi:hypothetical protein
VCLKCVSDLTVLPRVAPLPMKTERFLFLSKVRGWAVGRINELPLARNSDALFPGKVQFFLDSFIVGLSALTPGSLSLFRSCMIAAK